MDNAELRKLWSNITDASLFQWSQISATDLKRLLDESDELARLKAGPWEVTGPGPLLFLMNLLTDVETQREIAAAEAKKLTTVDATLSRHYAARAHAVGYVAERIRYFLETPAKEEESK